MAASTARSSGPRCTWTAPRSPGVAISDCGSPVQPRQIELAQDVPVVVPDNNPVVRLRGGVGGAGADPEADEQRQHSDSEQSP